MPKKKSPLKRAAKAPRKTLSAKPVKAAQQKPKATSKALQESQYQLNLALKAAHMGIWDWNIKTNVVRWSDNVHAILQLPPDTFDGSLEAYFELVHPDDRPHVRDAINNTLHHGASYFSQHRIVAPDGGIAWVEVVGNAIADKNGAIAKLTGTVQNITQAKQDALEKEDWKTRYELVAASTGQVIYDYHTRTGIIHWSNNIGLVLGYAEAEVGTIDKWGALIHPDDRQKAIGEMEAAEATLAPYDIRYRFMLGSGRYINVHDRGFFMPDQSGKAYRMLGAMQDITEMVRTEASLAESVRFKESLDNTIPGILYVSDLTSQNNIYVNRNVENLLGYSLNEIHGMTSNAIRDLVHPDDMARMPRWTDEPYQTVKESEYRVRAKSGEWRWHLARTTVFDRDANGRVTQVVGLAQDITERKQNEERLRESEQSYRDLFNMVAQEIYILSLDGLFIDVNQGCVRTYGYTREEFFGMRPEQLSAEGRNDYAALERAFALAKAGTPQSLDWWGRKKNGSIFLKEVHISRGVYFGQDVFIATAWDITERNQAEENLRESERRFRKLIHDLNIGVLLQGVNGEVILSNTAALELLGLTEDQLQGRTPFDPLWQAVNEDGSAFAAEGHPALVALRTGRAVSGVVMGLQRHGTPVWLLVNAVPLAGNHDTVREVICTLTDITERRMIEEELKESELRFRTLQQASFGGIGLHDKGVIIDCNQGLSDVTGFTREELVGQDGLNLIAAEWRPYVVDKIRSGYEKPYDAEGVRKDGSRYALEIHAKNIPYRGRSIRVTEFRDISDRKVAEQKIMEQNARLIAITEDLKRKNEQMEEFTQIVSHNLRSPVGNILTLLSFFENSNKEEEKAEYLHLLKESGTTTLKTLFELNEVLKIKQNRNIERQSIDLDQVFAHVRSMLSAKITEIGAEVTTDFSRAPGLMYPNIYMESILLNLLSNSLKYVRTHVKPEIHFKTYIDEGNTVLEATDNGLGINLERYGHQVFKLHKTFHRHPESRGIGLFMIKNQIEAMGGEISVLSEVNVGTTFIINFNKYSVDGL